MRTQKRLLSVLLISLMLAAVVANASAAVTLDCQLGYDGAVTFLRPIPFQASITGVDRDFSGTLQLEVQRYEMQYDRYDLPISSASGSTVNVTMPVTLSYRQGGYTVKWVENGTVVAQTELKPTTYIDPTSLIIGVLSDTDKSLSQFEVTQTNDPLKRMEYWNTIKLTAESFPADEESMGAFDMLMVDGADLSALTAPQQEALEKWLSAGGLVIVGGGAQAASAFPYFSRYTGVTAGALTDGGDVSQTFLDAFKSTEKPLGSAVRLVGLNGASGKAIGGEPLLVDVASLGEGKVLTCAFSLSDAPFSAWQGRYALWQRILLEYEGDFYTSMLGKRGMGGYSSSATSFYLDSGISDSITIPNGSGMALPVILLAAFVLLVGFGGYFLLKRLDKRDWMWLSVPALSLVFALGLWGVSGSLGLQKPAAASYTVLRIAEDGAKESFTGVSAASMNAGRIKLAAQEGVIDPLDNNNYYDVSSSGTTGEQPKTLRNVYEYRAAGGQASVEMPNDKAWSQIGFSVENAPLADCDVSGECVMEGDALVFTVTNKGTLALEPGVIITDYGFVMTEALLPGQTLTATLKPDPVGASNQLSADGSGIKNGVLLDDTTLERFSYYDLFQAYSRELRELQKSDPVTYSTENNSLKNRLLQGNANGTGWDGNSNCFHYLAFSDQLCSPALVIDDEPVTRAASYGVVDASLRYNPIGKDGSVRFLKGSFPVYQVAVDDKGAPMASTLISGAYAYFQMNTGNPTFGYDMSLMPERMELTRFAIRPTYAYYSYIVSLYNAKTGEWDDAITYDYDATTGKKNEKVTVKELSDYIDGEHMLYAQFRKQSTKDDYAEISTPMLTMDGRLK